MPCRTVAVEAPPNESTADVSINNINSPNFNTIEVQYTITNTVTSGDGESLSPTARTTLNGSVVDETVKPVSPGNTFTNRVRIDDAPAGSNEICVELV